LIELHPPLTVAGPRTHKNIETVAISQRVLRGQKVRVLRGAFIELVGLYEGMSGERRVTLAPTTSSRSEIGKALLSSDLPNLHAKLRRHRPSGQWVFFLLPVSSRRIGIVRQVSAQQNVLWEKAVVKLTT
jgi:hypothetical protein